MSHKMSPCFEVEQQSYGYDQRSSIDPHSSVQGPQSPVYSTRGGPSWPSPDGRIGIPSPSPSGSSETSKASELLRSHSQDNASRNVPYPRKTAEGRIPRPQNQFMLFRSYWLKNAPPELHGKQKGNVSKIVGAAWNSLSAEERLEWQRKAEDVKDLHRMTYPEYKFQPVQKRKRHGEVSSEPTVAELMAPFTSTFHASVPPSSCLATSASTYGNAVKGDVTIFPGVCDLEKSSTYITSAGSVKGPFAALDSSACSDLSTTSHTKEHPPLIDSTSASHLSDGQNMPTDPGPNGCTPGSRNLDTWLTLPCFSEENSAIQRRPELHHVTMSAAPSSGTLPTVDVPPRAFHPAHVSSSAALDGESVSPHTCHYRSPSQTPDRSSLETLDPSNLHQSTGSHVAFHVYWDEPALQKDRQILEDSSFYSSNSVGQEYTISSHYPLHPRLPSPLVIPAPQPMSSRHSSSSYGSNSGSDSGGSMRAHDQRSTQGDARRVFNSPMNHGGDDSFYSTTGGALSHPELHYDALSITPASGRAASLHQSNSHLPLRSALPQQTSYQISQTQSPHGGIPTLTRTSDSAYNWSPHRDGTISPAPSLSPHLTPALPARNIWSPRDDAPAGVGLHRRQPQRIHGSLMPMARPLNQTRSDPSLRPAAPVSSAQASRSALSGWNTGSALSSAAGSSQYPATYTGVPGQSNTGSAGFSYGWEGTTAGGVSTGDQPPHIDVLFENMSSYSTSQLSVMPEGYSRPGTSDQSLSLGIPSYSTSTHSLPSSFASEAAGSMGYSPFGTQFSLDSEQLAAQVNSSARQSTGDVTLFHGLGIDMHLARGSTGWSGRVSSSDEMDAGYQGSSLSPFAPGQGHTGQGGSSRTSSRGTKPVSSFMGGFSDTVDRK